MALSPYVRRDLQLSLEGGPTKAYELAVACALAVLELDFALENLELKVQRAERLAGRHGEELP